MLESAKDNLNIRKLSQSSAGIYSILVLIVCLIVFFSRSYWLQGGNFKITSAQNSSGILPGLALPEADRKYLWDIEHHATLLSAHGFDKIKSALLRDEDDSLLSLFSDNFTATIPSGGNAQEVSYNYGKVLKANTQRASFVTLNKKTFSTWLLKKMQLFASPPGIKIQLVGLRPKDRNKYDDGWIAKFKLRVWGIADDQSPLELFYKINVQLARPTEEAIKRGGWISSFDITSNHISQSNYYLMRDVAAESGIDLESLHDNWDYGPSRTIVNTGGVYIFDYNQDGILDLLVNDVAHYRGYLLYQGLGGFNFRDVTLDVGLPPLNSPSLVAVADLDNDGWEDLIIGPGLIFKNIHGDGFENVSSSSNLSSAADLHKTQLFSSIAIADYDKDGLLDIYIYRSSPNPSGGSWIAGKMEENYETQLLKNKGEWQFEDVTSIASADGGKRSVFSAVWLDANNDNWPDLYLIHEFGNGVLLANQGDGSFSKRLIVETPSDFGSMGLASGDFDNDGLIDLYVASMYSSAGYRVIGNLPNNAYSEDVMLELERMVAGSQLYQNMGDFGFSPKGASFDVTEIGWAYGPAMTDLNNDGWLDIFATAGFVSRSRDEPDG